MNRGRGRPGGSAGQWQAGRPVPGRWSPSLPEPAAGQRLTRSPVNCDHDCDILAEHTGPAARYTVTQAGE